MHAKLQISTIHFYIQIKIGVCLQQVPELVTKLKCIWKKTLKQLNLFPPLAWLLQSYNVSDF